MTMQRKPFKKSHKVRNIIIFSLSIIIILGIAFTFFGQNNSNKTEQTSSSSSTPKKQKSKAEPTTQSSSSEDLASESTSIPEAPAGPAVSSAISTVTDDATQAPIEDNTSNSPSSSSVASSSGTSSDSSQATSSSQPAASFGNWSATTYEQIAIGSATYDDVRSAYGNPTYLTASDRVYATWQSKTGIKVSIVFTPTGNDDNLKLIASSKSQSGLQ
ncbi:50S ribosomal protein L20 [Leuconostoc carnosum JB16]|uniref:50S ribosomal protein L20 n=2 Tax=Leuconostoc carnosum TaxID=1252 RepID=K0DEA9_LEUCJ|nr:50S ribosomal protein L20 [Leuconostoc carnosum JB16]